ncbi:MAG: NADH-quinone oxidoreductase subunit M [Verrucomicrobiae bacterium]|nr:NADH-quinone oxidoreductase subunit M [Verrucomicrobiae bacterium]
MLLQYTIWISLIGAFLVAMIPARDPGSIRWTALFSMVGSLAVAVAAYARYDAVAGGYQDVLAMNWIPSLGAQFLLGADGISLPLLVLTGVIGLTGVLFSWNVAHRTKEFFIYYLILIAGVYGVFLSMDLLLLFVFLEIAIVPKYFLISIWGSTRREYAAMKLVLYSFVASVMILIGLLCLHAQYRALTGIHTFDVRFFVENAWLLPHGFQLWCFPLVFLGFATLAGLFPLHTWAPTGHVAAPTAASMLLAGVVMKMGSYGCLRAGLLLFPHGLQEPVLFFDFLVPQFWFWTFAGLAVFGIVYGAGASLVQKDFKFVVGYSSVSHMGFVILGIVTANALGLTGALLQMISHGLIGALLFACVGRMIYDRTHTRHLDALPAFDLRSRMPALTAIVIVAFLASAGLPGMSGFIAEFTVLLGTMKVSPLLCAAVGLGILVTFAYSLRLLHLVFWTTPVHGVQNAECHEPLPPLTLPEKLASGILIFLIVLIGLLPHTVTGVMQSSIEQSLRQMNKKADIQTPPLAQKPSPVHP